MDPRLLVCALCGAMSFDVTMALVRWRGAEPRYGQAPRCKDHDGCFQRVLDNGDDWPVDDGRDVRLPRAQGKE